MQKSNYNELDQYMKWASRHPVLTKSEEKVLAKKAKTGCKASREKLIVSNLRFVVQIANQFKAYTKSGCYTLGDLVQEGNVGLLKAIKKYDPETGNRFITYAVWWIRAQIMIYLTTNHSVIRFGTTNLERKSFFKLGLLTELLNAPSYRKDELRINIADQLSIDIKEVIKLESRVSANTVSTNTRIHKSTDASEDCRLIDILTEDEHFENQHIADDFLGKFKDVILYIISDFTEREKTIIEARWLSNESSTLQQIGNEYNISRERVRQIESRLFTRIRDYLYANGLDKEIEEFLGIDLNSPPNT